MKWISALLSLAMLVFGAFLWYRNRQAVNTWLTNAGRTSKGKMRTAYGRVAKAFNGFGSTVTHTESQPAE